MLGKSQSGTLSPWCLLNLSRLILCRGWGVLDTYCTGAVYYVAGRESYDGSAAMVLPIALVMALIILFRQAWGLFLYLMFLTDGGRVHKVICQGRLNVYIW